MSASVFNTGEERLDILIQMVPITFEGSDYVMNALCILTAVMLSRASWGLNFGLSSQLVDKFNEIRLYRLSHTDIDVIDVSIIYDFYCDVLSTYKKHLGRIKFESDFTFMRMYQNITGVRGVQDGKFFSLHSLLFAMCFNTVPDHWDFRPEIRIIDETTVRDKAKSSKYCYLKLIKSSYVCIVATLLGPKPTLGSLLSILTPRVLVDSKILDTLRVIRNSNDNTLHITTFDSVNGSASLPVSQLLEFCDNDDFREDGLLDIFDRIGSDEIDARFDDLFKKALDAINVKREPILAYREPTPCLWASRFDIDDAVRNFCGFSREEHEAVELQISREAIEGSDSVPDLMTAEIDEELAVRELRSTANSLYETVKAMYSIPELVRDALGGDRLLLNDTEFAQFSYSLGKLKSEMDWLLDKVSKLRSSVHVSKYVRRLKFKDARELNFHEYLPEIT